MLAATAAALSGVMGAAFAFVNASSAAASGRFTQRGTVVWVVDGDTVDVRLTGGKRERVRLIGIDATERGACFASQATAQARALALGEQVVLRVRRRTRATVTAVSFRTCGCPAVETSATSSWRADSRRSTCTATPSSATRPMRGPSVERRVRRVDSGSSAQHGPPRHSRSSPRPHRRRARAAIPATRRACRSSVISTAPTSARSGRRRFGSSARIPTGWMATTTGSAASSGPHSPTCRC